MAGKKFYGVKFGDGSTGIFTDWSICKDRIRGEKGVSYKGFGTEEEALAFVNSENALVMQSTKNFEHEITDIKFNTDIAIYVDGSYRNDIYSYGFVVVDVSKDVAIHEQRGKGTDLDAAKLRNVSGEMKGAMEAMVYCINSGIKEVTICYDYSGIEMWALGSWKRNNIFTKGYHDFYQCRKDRLKVHFMKIKGHSGDKWNERADILAKEGLEES